MPHDIPLFTFRIQGVDDGTDPTISLVKDSVEIAPANDNITLALEYMWWEVAWGPAALQLSVYDGGLSGTAPTHAPPDQYGIVWTGRGNVGATGGDPMNWLEGRLESKDSVWKADFVYDGIDPYKLTSGLHMLDQDLGPGTWNPNASMTIGPVDGVPIERGWAAAGLGLTHYPEVQGVGGTGFGVLNCFMHGTIFRTLKDNTEVPIEVQNIKAGDLVKTEVFVNQKECQFSQEGWQRVKGTIQRGLTADQYAEKTVILPKDALGEGKPEKDLHLTWGHGLLLKEMKEEWKNEEYDGNHGTYSKTDALVKGDFIKLLAGHCSLCRKPNEEEKKKAKEESERRVYHHLQIEDDEERSQHALLSNGLATESLV